MPFLDIAAAPIRGAGPKRLFSNLIDLLKGTWAARRALGQARPDAIFATGGYVSVPVVVGGWLRGIPSLIYLPDLEPGLAVKALALIARRVAVTNEEAARYFNPRKVVVTGYPVRGEFASVSCEDARKRFGISADKVLLVFGGSRGAAAINRAVERNLEELLEMAEIIHVCGQQEHTALESRRGALPEAKRARYHLYDYLHDMPAALKAADLVVSRAGASILGEFTVAGVPAVLVPYPFAGEHQKNNALYLAERGAAVIVDNDKVEQELLPAVQGMLRDDARRAAMRESALRLGRPDAARKIAELLRSLPAGKAV